MGGLRYQHILEKGFLEQNSLGIPCIDDTRYVIFREHTLSTETTMPLYEHPHDTVRWHMDDITSRIIAKSGIPSDRFHFGKIILQSLTDNPDDVAQVSA